MPNDELFSSDFIEFRRVRNVGQILGDTFGFMRQEYKLMLRSFARTAGPWLLAAFVFVLVGAIVSPGGLASGSTGSHYDPATDTYVDSSGGSGSFFGLLFILGMISGAVGMYFLIATSINYCGVYVRMGAGNFDVQDIREAVKKDGGRTFLGALISNVVTSIASNLCFFPGLYLSVPMNLMMVEYILERDTTISGAFSEGFTLSKDRWWVSFLSSFTISIILVAAAVVVVFSPLLAPDAADPHESINIVTFVQGVLFLAILVAAGAILFSMYQICNVFIYYANREYHFGDSIAEEIDNIDGAEFDEFDEELRRDANYRSREDDEPAADDPIRWSRAPRDNPDEKNSSEDGPDDTAGGDDREFRG